MNTRTFSRGISVAGLVTCALASPARAAHPFQYNIVGLYLSGPEYGIETRDSRVDTMNASGIVLGRSDRLSPGLYNGHDAWLYDGTSIIQLGLVGGDYTYDRLDGNVFQQSLGLFLNDAGQATGYSRRRNGAGSLGEDGWFYDGSVTRLIGLSGGVYEYDVLPGIKREGRVKSMNESGQLAGQNKRYTSTGEPLGTDPWRSDGNTTIQIGLNGQNFEYTTSSGQQYRAGEAHKIYPDGRVLGTNRIYTPTGGGIGYAAWITDGNSYQNIGLTGPEYEGELSGYPVGETLPELVRQESNFVAGYTRRQWPHVEQDTWRYDGTTTVQIGLIGGDYEAVVNDIGVARSSEVTYLNDSGYVVGYSKRMQGIAGDDPWIFNGVSTHFVGLTGSAYEGGTERVNYLFGPTATGKVIGYAERRAAGDASLGSDAWIFDGESTHVLGLSGSDYEFISPASNIEVYRHSSPQGISGLGYAAGATERFGSSGAYLGSDAWFFDGEESHLIGLIGPEFEYMTSDGLFRNSFVRRMSNLGHVVGESFSYDEAGVVQARVGWFYDPTTQLTLPVIIDEDPNSIDFFLQYVNDSGTVFGLLHDRDFWWDQTSGLNELGAIVEGGLTAAGWDVLSRLYIGESIGISNNWSQYIVGHGLQLGQIDGQTAYLMKVVPEPSALGLLAGVAMLAMRRRSSR